MKTSDLLVVVLLIAVSVIGVLYYQEKQESADIKIELPKVEVE